MKNIYIAITEKDINAVKKIIQHDDILLTDIECTLQTGMTLFVRSIKADDHCLVSEVSNWFREKSLYYGFSYGHVNQFYQCSIRPILRYIKTVKYTLKHYEQSRIRFHLPTRSKQDMSTSVYYLAEYESNGKYLYNRTEFILPYIESYLNSNGIDFDTYRKQNSPPIQRILYNPIRLFLVFIYRLTSDLRLSKFFGGSSLKLSAVEYERVYLVRSASQALEVLNWVKGSKRKSLVLLVKRTKNYLEYEFIYNQLRSTKNTDVVYSLGFSSLDVLVAYSQSIAAIPIQKTDEFEYEGLFLNLTQALREILVMNPSVRLYEKALQKTLHQLKFKELISFEQKSPQAFVDSTIASSKGSVSFQVQTVQQESFDIPQPVCADYFLCETPKILREFAKEWSSRTDRLRYVGTIGACISQYKSYPVTKNKKLRVVVFLSTSVNLNQNLSLLNILREANLFELADVVVKLHPRDTAVYDKYIPSIKMIKDYDKDFCSFIRDYDLALTLPSAVIKKILYSGTPFLVYSTSMCKIGTMSSYLPEDMKIVSSPPELIEMLNNVTSVIDAYNRLFKKYISSKGLVFDIEDIDSAIQALTSDS